MKKLFYLLFLLPMAFFASCSDDDDLPQVDLTLTIDNVAMVDNNIYAVVGDTINIENYTVKSLTSQNASVTNVIYSLDGIPGLGMFVPYPPMVSPFKAYMIPTEQMVGKHVLGVSSTVLQVEKPIATAYCQYPLVIVKDSTDLPQGAVLGVQEITGRIDPKK